MCTMLEMLKANGTDVRAIRKIAEDNATLPRRPHRRKVKKAPPPVDGKWHTPFLHSTRDELRDFAKKRGGITPMGDGRTKSAWWNGIAQAGMLALPRVKALPQPTRQVPMVIGISPAAEALHVVQALTRKLPETVAVLLPTPESKPSARFAFHVVESSPEVPVLPRKPRTKGVPPTGKHHPTKTPFFAGCEHVHAPQFGIRHHKDRKAVRR
jgi:hypothetical protein